MQNDEKNKNSGYQQPILGIANIAMGIVNIGCIALQTLGTLPTLGMQDSGNLQVDYIVKAQNIRTKKSAFTIQLRRYKCSEIIASAI